MFGLEESAWGYIINIVLTVFSLLLSNTYKKICTVYQSVHHDKKEKASQHRSHYFINNWNRSQGEKLSSPKMYL